jgi:phosphate starvation-inducible PhoH-like protein
MNLHYRYSSILYNIFKFFCLSLFLSNIYAIKNNKKLYNPKTDNQREYVKALNNNDIDLLFCTGPAGTGKTLFACSYGIEQLNKNNIDKFIITRPTVTIDENIGFLPGDINKKMSPFTQHIYDIFLEYYTQKEINSLINDKIIEVVPLAFMQGRTFKNSIIIGDEMQNSTPNQMFMLTTRLGTNSKMVITGDPTQTINKNNGLKNIIDKINYKYDYDYDSLEDDKIKIITMNGLDIQRHHIVKIMNQLYQN